jgi:hypothetical protein
VSIGEELRDMSFQFRAGDGDNVPPVAAHG